MPDISIHALLAESDLDASKSSRYFAYFYPRSPCGERLLYVVTVPSNNAFLSTLSLRRATKVPEDQYTALSISIHALLAESDATDK